MSLAMADTYSSDNAIERVLQDVMLPELDRDIADIEGRLEEMEQEEAIWMRRGAGGEAAVFVRQDSRVP